MAGSVFTVRSGETDQPVAGAVVTLSASTAAGPFSSVYTSSAAGEFTLDRSVLVTPAPRLDVATPDFITRNTLLRADEATITLWPRNSATGLDEDFSSTVAYSNSVCPAINSGQAPLRRIASATQVMRVSFGPSLDDVAAAQVHQLAIERLNTALAGAVRFELSSTPTPAASSFIVDIDPNHGTCTAGPEPLRAATEVRFENGNISGGRLIFCTVNAARSTGLVAHELGHTVGLYHSASTSDVMFCSVGRPVLFSPREQLVLKLMRQRRPGNRWPDNDRNTTSAFTSGVATEVTTCGASH